VVLAGLDDEKTGFWAMRKGAADYLLKNQSFDALLVCKIIDVLNHAKKSITF